MTLLNVFQNGNLKDCLMKFLNLLIHLVPGHIPPLNYNGDKAKVKFYGTCLKQNKIRFTYLEMVNM